MLGSLKKPFSVIGISETWLTDCTAELINITGYNFVSNHRKFKTGGGVDIYLQNDLLMNANCQIQRQFIHGDYNSPWEKHHCWTCV